MTKQKNLARDKNKMKQEVWTHLAILEYEAGTGTGT
jgi:hypothetical protein